MWIVELNVLGHRFTRQVPDHRAKALSLNPRAVQSRLAQLRHPRAAA
jgi:hypothetical protein